MRRRLTGCQAVTAGGRVFPYCVACSNACAICSTLQVVAVRPDDLDSHRQSARRKPAGTEIAGFDMKVMYQHERIQSIYVVIGVPAICVGYGIFTSNGSPG